MGPIPSPTDDPIVEAVRSASKRVLGTRALCRKEPISPTLIHAGFFRFDDVSRIRRSDISFKEGFMVIKVLKSKNDQLRKGDEVVVSQLSSDACPVALLKRYLVMFKIPPDSKDLIFKPISRGKGCCKLVAPDKPISYSTIRGAFRRDLLSLGVEPSKFGLHSLRSGGATMAANNGVNDRIFQRHGRWK